MSDFSALFSLHPYFFLTSIYFYICSSVRIETAATLV